jgi:hypothetical protein
MVSTATLPLSVVEEFLPQRRMSSDALGQSAAVIFVNFRPKEH